MDIGIIGPSQSGKTTVFTAITGVEPGYEKGKKAIVKVPDERLDHLKSVFNPKKQVNTTITFIDASPPKVTKKGGADQGFLNFIKTVSALLVVLPCFRAGAKKELDDILDLLLLSDIEFIERMLEKEKKIKIDPKYKGPSIDLLNKMHKHLDEGSFLRGISITPNEQRSLSGYELYTRMPIFAVLNVSEKQSNKDILSETQEVIEYLNEVGIGYVSLCGSIEMEISQLNEEDKPIFMQEYSIEETASGKVIQKVFDLLGLQVFFTAGEDECRAWTISKGDSAVVSAGKVHTDIAKQFIRAEVCSYEDFIDCNNSLKEAKNQGKLRLEGKEYTVKDGDIITFRHNA
jgi:ribosome-binding ATPase